MTDPAAPRTIRKLICWANGFIGTWLDPGAWATRLRLWLDPNSSTVVRFIGHRLDADNPIHRLEDDREHIWMECVRCGEEVYMGWTPWYGEPGPTLDEIEKEIG